MMDLSIPYYKDMSRISNSNIGWFLKYGPTYLHKKLTGQIPDEESATLSRGTMIHESILLPEEFDKDYIVFEGKRPQSAQQEKFCKAYLQSLELEPNKKAIDAYSAVYSIRGKSEDKILAEAKALLEDLSDYIKCLQDGRTIISKYDLRKCEEVQTNIAQHKFASKLLNDSAWEEHHEFHINWRYKEIDCKSLLDCVKFDFEHKKCQIVDLKTTSHVWTFEESMHTFDYCRQLCYYWMAVQWYLRNERGEDPANWEVEFFILAIDNCYLKDSSQVRVFEIEPNAVLARLDTIENALWQIGWHMMNNSWDHSMEYYNGTGCETLDL